MRAVSVEEFRSIGNWSSTQYFFRDHENQNSSTKFLGVAEKYTFIDSHRFGLLSIIYYEDFTLKIEPQGRALEVAPKSLRDDPQSYWLLDFYIYKPTSAGDIPLSQVEAQTLLPNSYNKINYSLFESGLEPGMLLL